MTPAQRGHLAMLLFSAVVAGSFSLGAQVARDIAPLALNAVRFWVAAAVLAFVVARTSGFERRMFLAPWRYAVLGGLFGIYFVLMFEGLKTALPVSMSAVFTLTPVLSAIFGWILLRQITTARMAFALAVGALGALWVIFRADFMAFLTFAVGRGEAIFFVGCLCHAIYTPMVRKLNRGEPATVFAFATLLGGGVVLTGFGWRDIVDTAWSDLPVMVWVTLFYIAVFASS
ncbi:MAG: DMT family transporter, partial [Roseobacter sp.]